MLTYINESTYVCMVKISHAGCSQMEKSIEYRVRVRLQLDVRGSKLMSL